MAEQKVEFVVDNSKPEQVLRVPMRLRKCDDVGSNYTQWECLVDDKWLRLAFLTPKGELGLSKQAVKIPGIHTNAHGEVITF